MSGWQTSIGSVSCRLHEAISYRMTEAGRGRQDGHDGACASRICGSKIAVEMLRVVHKVGRAIDELGLIDVCGQLQRFGTIFGEENACVRRIVRREHSRCPTWTACLGDVAVE